MMAPEESDTEETLQGVPSQLFDDAPSSNSSPVSALGGWATGGVGALFAVTKVINTLTMQRVMHTHRFRG